MDDRLKDLLLKYLNRTCTEAERDELLAKLRFLPHSENLDEVLGELWEEESVDLIELEWDQLQELHDRKSSIKIAWWNNAWYRRAIAAALVGAIVYFFFLFQNTSSEEWVIYETGYGETLDITLEDGSSINLNADSKLKWNKKWKKSQSRAVILEGEAFFDIAQVDQKNPKAKNPEGDLKTKSIPFNVSTSDVTIHVLGTSFNVSQRRGKTDVLLEQGSIQLELFKQNQNKTKTPDTDDDVEQFINLSPGDFVSYSSFNETLVQKTIESPEQISDWKRGILSYSGITFAEMLKNLEDIYGTALSTDDENLLKTRVKFNMPYEDWQMVQQMLERMLNIEMIQVREQEYQIKPNPVYSSVIKSKLFSSFL